MNRFKNMNSEKWRIVANSYGSDKNSQSSWFIVSIQRWPDGKFFSLGQKVTVWHTSKTLTIDHFQINEILNVIEVTCTGENSTDKYEVNLDELKPI